MSLNQPLISELQQEAQSTRKMLERVPEDKHSWKPHEKSMSLGQLASHVAELSSFITSMVTLDELDFSKEDYTIKQAASNKELLKMFDEHFSQLIESLQNADDENMLGNWRLRSGDQIFFEMPKLKVIRSLGINHYIHHRGQLSVYLRLLDVPLPSVYGPTADEQVF